MDLLQAAILSIIEGVTEFLPISSTGHLVLISKLLSVTQNDFTKTFEIAIQLGAILSVVFLYWRRLLSDWETLKRAVLVFIPTGILGLLFYRIVKNVLLGNIYVTVFTLGVGGLLIILFERYFKKHPGKLAINQLSFKNSLILGVIQSLSMIPGVSRAGATIFGGMFLGLSREAATELSFMVAIPTMFAATGFDLLKNAKNFEGSQIEVLMFGIVISFLAALGAVKWLIGYIKGHDLTYFGIYRIILAILFLLIH